MKGKNARQEQFREMPRLRFGLALSMCLTVGATAAPEAFLKIDELREGWESTYGSIKSMKVAYSDRLTSFKPSPKEPNAPRPVRVMHIERLERQGLYHLKTSLSEQGFNRPEDLLANAFDGERNTSYVGAYHTGEVKLGMQNSAAPRTNSLKQYLLLDAIRSRNQDEDIPAFRQYFENREVQVLPELESVAGTPCHVMEFTGPYVNGKVWLAHEKGFLPLKFEFKAGDPTHGYLFEQRVVDEIASVATDLGVFWYPTKAHRSLRLRNGEESTNELNVTAFVPNVPVARESCRVDFPPGTRINDYIAGILYRTGEIAEADLLGLERDATRATEANQPGGTEVAGASGPTRTRTLAASAAADQNDRGAVRAPGSWGTPALAGHGVRRSLWIPVAGLGIVLLLTGIYFLRTDRRGLAREGR
jgi:hypothetical protein